jgi:hypothetical protein
MGGERVTRRQKDVSRLVREKRQLQKYKLAAVVKPKAGKEVHYGTRAPGTS